jgi:hypothetical protein
VGSVARRVAFLVSAEGQTVPPWPVGPRAFRAAIVAVLYFLNCGGFGVKILKLNPSPVTLPV